MPLLIDGHNLIAQVPGLSLADPDDERQLVVLLRAYCWRVKKKGTVVFDNGQPGGQGSWSNTVLSVRFAPPGKTADEVLRGILTQTRDRQGLIVVSGDRDVMIAAQRVGAQVRAPGAFAQELLASPLLPGPKETGLRPEEVAAWEAEFKAPRRPKS